MPVASDGGRKSVEQQLVSRPAGDNKRKNYRALYFLVSWVSHSDLQRTMSL